MNTSNMIEITSKVTMDRVFDRLKHDATSKIFFEDEIREYSVPNSDLVLYILRSTGLITGRESIMLQEVAGTIFIKLNNNTEK